MLGLVVVLLVDPLAGQELCRFVGEHVAVVVDEVVFIGSVLEGDVLQEVLVDLLRDLGLSDHDFLDGLAEGSGLGRIGTDPSTEVVLLAEDDEGGVVDGVDLLPDHHHAHALGHALGDVVDVERNSAAHLENFLNI